MNKSVDMQIVEAFEGLLENALNNLFFHSTRPAVMHYVGGATLVHEAGGNI
jgi:hypothetical protein